MSTESSTPARKSVWGHLGSMATSFGVGIGALLGAVALLFILGVAISYNAKLNSSMENFEAARHVVRSVIAPDNPVTCVEFTDTTVSDEELRQGLVLTLHTKERVRVLESFGRDAQGCKDGRFALRMEPISK